MFLWDFDHHDTNTVRVRDPKLHESPCLSPWFAENRYAEIHQASMLCVHISDLHPQSDALSRRIHRPPTDFEKTVAQEEHQARCLRAAELPVDGETQRVSVEPMAAGGVCGTQKNSAAENLHTAILPADGNAFVTDPKALAAVRRTEAGRRLVSEEDSAGGNRPGQRPPLPPEQPEHPRVRYLAVHDAVFPQRPFTHESELLQDAG